MFDHQDSTDIAVIGMAGRFPKAPTIELFWRSLCDGVEGISFFTDQELEAFGVDPAVLKDPNFVKAGPILEDDDRFDAAFFGYSPREAELMDPQHRIFLECAWEALEHAGYDPETFKRLIGVYAGAAINTYLVYNLMANAEVVKLLHDLAIGDQLQIVIGNAGDFLTTRVSYKLNLKGPSHLIQSACSTSLVAVHSACQSLLYEECDMALAGGVSINANQRAGYRYVRESLASPDGHCRAFDARGQGTIFGSGVGVVVLKRLDDALADGDTIHAVIKGSAINSDGSLKVGYTAPSVDGQAAVIAAALANAEVPAETISYVETHGTGTALGDPIEVQALTKAFRASTGKNGFCAIGSVKTNVGHLDAAAGITSFIKAVLALKHHQIPPSLHFHEPNPNIDFANSPFYVNTKLAEWPAGRTPRRAGVSSFGIGGTNAHVIVEEAPPAPAPGESRPWQLLLLSARTGTALERATANLLEHLRQHPDLDLADVAYTLQAGRRGFGQRRMLVCRDRADVIAALESLDPRRVATQICERNDRPVVFLFPGQGAQYAQMGSELYQAEPVFREHVDHCAGLLTPLLEFDIRQVLFPETEQAEAAGQLLEQTWLTQPALFVVEYALARLWMSWGVRPQAMIGHSIGEYVAACLADVFSLEDALALVVARGQLMQQLPDGAMLSVALPAEDLQPLLGPDLSLAAINGPALCVVSGAHAAIATLQERLATQGVECRRLHTSHAFHSWMMDPILDLFAEQLRHVTLRPPRIPYISNLTGTWMTESDAQDPRYWARQLRQTVRFADGLGVLLQKPERVFLEVGPGRALSTLVRASAERERGATVLTSLRHPHDQQPDVAFLLQTLGRLWLAGVPLDWAGVYAHERRRRVPLPTYPFERQRYWIEPERAAGALQPRGSGLRRLPDLADWFYLPFWKPAVLPVGASSGASDSRRWLLFVDEDGLSAALAQRLAQRGDDVTTVLIGEQYARLNERTYTVRPGRRDDYVALLAALAEQDRRPDTVVQLWGAMPNDRPDEPAERGFASVIGMAQALGQPPNADEVELVVVSSGAQSVAGESLPWPERAAVLGACRVISQEYPQLICRSVDIPPTEPGTWQADRLIDQLLAELDAGPPDPIVAYRGNQRWVQDFEAVHLAAGHPERLREGGVYLISGGLAAASDALAVYLVRTLRATLVLAEDASFPARSAWAQRLEQLGATVLPIAVDLADQDAMRSMIDQIDQRCGALHGVIHTCAGAPDSAEHDAVGRLRREARALAALEHALQGRALDFCVIQSGLAVIAGGPGMLDDAAAGALASAFVQRHNQTCRVPWMSVNWDARPDAEADAAGAGAPLDTWALTPEETVAAFLRLLALDGAAQVAVSTADLPARIGRALRQPAARPDVALQQPAVAHPRPQLASSYVAPATALERRMAELWQELLGIEQIGIYDDFFEAGGHSLLATRLVSRLRDVFQVELPLRSIFEAPTVASLAASVELAQRVAQDAHDLAIPRTAHDGHAPLSFAQQRLWALDWLQPGSPVYTMPTGVRLAGLLKLAALQRGLDEIVRRHDVLRTTFAVVDGQPVQVIAPPSKGAATTPPNKGVVTTPLLPMLDLRALPAAAREAETQRLTLEEAQRSFDLGRGPLVRFTLLWLDDQAHVLLLTIHHIIADFWSIGVLIDELTVLYGAFAADQPAPLPDLPIQYADYAIWQQAWLKGGAMEAQLAYWRRQLADLPTLQLPWDRPRPPVQTFRGAKQFFTLPADLGAALTALSRQEGATLFMTALAAFQVVLHYYSGQDDIVVGTDVANRTRSETEKLIGFFVNQLVLRTNLSGNPTFRTLLERVRATTLDAYAHQDMPFDQLVKALKIERDPSRTPLFQVKITLQNVPVPALDVAGLALAPLEIDNKTAKYDLLMNLEDSTSDLPSWLEYNTDVFSAARVSRIVEHFEAVLQAVVAKPDTELRELVRMLTEADNRQQQVQAQAFGQVLFQKLKQTRRQAIRATSDHQTES